MSGAYNSVGQVLEQLLEPLVREDGGELFIVRHDEQVLALHLRGRFSGCPGNTLAIRRVIEPALKKIAPRLKINVSSGELLPEDARPCGRRTA